MYQISAAKARWILKKHLRSKIFSRKKIFLFEKGYSLVDESKLAISPVNLGGGDCEERAWVLMGRVLNVHPTYLFGFAEGIDRYRERHAWCFCINKTETVSYVEPSTAEIVLPTKEQVYNFIR